MLLSTLGAAGIAPIAPANGQQIEITPDQTTVFSFSGFQGGPFLPETATAWVLDNADIREAEFTVSSNQAWLAVAPGAGQVGGILAENIDIEAILNTTEAAGLVPGLYTAIVSFSNITNGAGNTTRTVRLRVAPANFSVSPSFVVATATVNGPNPADVVVTLRSSGQEDLNYGVAWTPKSWFSVDRGSGTVPAGGTDTFRIAFNIAGLDPGTYSSQIEVMNTTNGAGSRLLPLSLTVKARGGSAFLKPDTDILVEGPVGKLPTILQHSTVVNDGENPIAWNAIVDQPWVSVTPASGQIAASDGLAGGLDERAVDIRVNIAAQALPAGTSTATVSFQSTFVNPLSGLITGVTFGTRVVQVVANPVLTLTRPAVGGVVTTDPAGASIDAGTATTKRLSFSFGEVVVVSAVPGDGYEFRGWAGDFPKDEETTNPIIIVMDDSKSLGALIAPILRELTLSTIGSGSGTIDMAPTGAEIENALAARYANGTSVTLTADPDAGSVFRGWAGNVPPGDELSNPLTILMDRERVISARFEPAISLNINVTAGGSVTIEPDLTAYAVGMTVILTAVPDDSFVFDGWSGDASGSEESLTLTLSGDTLINATFVADDGSGGGGGGNENTAKLFVDVQGDGVVTPNGGTYVKGATVTMIATPGLNADFVRWEQDASGAELTTTVIMDRDRTVRAVFEAVDGGSGGRPTTPLCGAAGILGFPALLVGWMSLAGWSRRR